MGIKRGQIRVAKSGMQAKHKDFVVVAAGNTFGKGADDS